ncbi:RagB/SusD family nutrient uptake outer membrane protein [Ancylomarina sp. 16SWW S1-10-2]|uniref:RagB/SusD family nutrient uptake outer membrane protein n=1 Tax=Ancylomarina sp. 16SWW S1-10-2 TaxID=2499681 RepID=UPI0012ADFA71|nr:RagB/SusD family nutrient uptake outer membrane protein [Ancylomarina sp. 16SWW S1-10-2]MRT94725.1 RagB/SusD family nutrient uptake outer membrane protein [Ancylomarina sp. 16SWW S1-10-2]
MKNILAILIISLVLFSSCEEYLDEKPSKTNQQEIESTDDINLLLDNALDLINNTHVILDVTFGNLTDDMYIYDEMYAVFAPWIPFDYIQSYSWQNEITAVSDKSWTASYKNIWLANYIINNVGGLEGSDNEKANLIAEAHLIKAYKMLTLMMKHCLYPSSANGDELGLSLKNSLEFDDLPARSNLQETLEDIEYHITEGLKIDKVRTDSWRESKGSAAALAARYYMYIHDFVNAKKYAQQALSLWDKMVNMETEVTIFDRYGFDLPSTNNLSVYSHDFYTTWDSQYKMYVTQDQNMFPSADLLALYEPSDLRNLFYSGWMAAVFFGVTENNKIYNKFSGVTFSGPDVAEMYLIVAECAGRDGDFATCMQNIESVRVNRFASADYVPMALPASVKEAVQLVVDERRRELPFTSSRWSDIKRLNNEGLLDPIILSRDFYTLTDGNVDFASPQTYILEPNSRKYARPLPNEVINLTDGKVEQNSY